MLLMSGCYVRAVRS